MSPVGRGWDFLPSSVSERACASWVHGSIVLRVLWVVFNRLVLSTEGICLFMSIWNLRVVHLDWLLRVVLWIVPFVVNISPKEMASQALIPFIVTVVNWHEAKIGIGTGMVLLPSGIYTGKLTVLNLYVILELSYSLPRKLRKMFIVVPWLLPNFFHR